MIEENSIIEYLTKLKEDIKGYPYYFKVSLCIGINGFLALQFESNGFSMQTQEFYEWEAPLKRWIIDCNARGIQLLTHKKAINNEK